MRKSVHMCDRYNILYTEFSSIKREMQRIAKVFFKGQMKKKSISHKGNMNIECDKEIGLFEK